MIKVSRLDVSEEWIKNFCLRNRIRRLSLFGQILGETYGSGSEVDFLVEFHSGRMPALPFLDLEAELGEKLSRPVRLHTPGFLSADAKDEVLRGEEDVYIAG